MFDNYTNGQLNVVPICLTYLLCFLFCLKFSCLSDSRYFFSNTNICIIFQLAKYILFSGLHFVKYKFSADGGSEGVAHVEAEGEAAVGAEEAEGYRQHGPVAVPHLHHVAAAQCEALLCHLPRLQQLLPVQPGVGGEWQAAQPWAALS